MIDKCLPQLRWLQVSRRGRDEAQMRTTGIFLSAASAS